MTSKKLETTIQKYLKGELTGKERDVFLKSFSDRETKDQFEKSVEINYLISMRYSQVDSKAAYRDFLSKIKSNGAYGTKNGIRRVAFKYAAIFLVIVGLSYLGYVEVTRTGESPLLQIEEKAITLQLGNGKIEVINMDGSTQVLNEEGRQVATQKEDKIIYKGTAGSGDLVYNELNIPYGKKFEIELSDGTIVHLNSGSSLKYPVQFIKGKDRQVFINGEAYFKVAEDKEHPFIVNAHEVNIRVLGTEFNVCSYSEDESINTVLVNGKVDLYEASRSYDPKTGASFEITPEQMGTWNKVQKKFEVRHVETDVYTAWMTGKLIFRDTPFKVMRKKLERHYNVAIFNNNGELDESTFNAVFDIESIEEVLETFDRNFGIKYKILDNQIIIYKPKPDQPM